MAMTDFLQMRRKYKKPHLRRWYHPHHKGKSGSDTYRQTPATKKKLHLIMKHKAGKKYYVAYKGKEYTVSEFSRKHPRLYKYKKRTKRRKRKR